MTEQKSKYIEIVDWIKKKIENGELTIGNRIYSENELVAIFGVSRQTVRHAISILCNEGLLERRRGSGTYISKPKERKKDTKRIAVITTYIDEYIFPSIIKRVEQRLSKEGYVIQLAFTNNSVEKERQILEGILRSKSVDGIIVEAVKSGLPNPNLHLYNALKEQDIPFIFINSYYPEIDAPHVSMNDRKAGHLVTQHLLSCGHRNIAAIFKCDDGQGMLRYAGYMDALIEADIRIRGERVIWIDTDEQRNLGEDAGRILRRIRNCTACVCYNDEVANKLVAICLEQGMKVPQDISITGMDNSDLTTYCEVPLTSAINPINELGEKVAQAMLDVLAGKAVDKAIELEPKLEIRHSVRMVSEI